MPYRNKELEAAIRANVERMSRDELEEHMFNDLWAYYSRNADNDEVDTFIKQNSEDKNGPS